MAERTLRILNKILDTIIAIVLILAVLYSVYSLWDNYQLYQGIHDLQVKLKDLKPKGKKYPLKIFAVLVVRSTDSYIFDPSKYKNNRQQFLNYVKMKANWMQNDKIEILNSQSGNYSVLALGTCSTDQVDDRTVVLAMYKK